MLTYTGLYNFCVRVEGLEPPHLAALDPKSSASTNFATPAQYSCFQDLQMTALQGTDIPYKKAVQI